MMATNLSGCCFSRVSVSRCVGWGWLWKGCGAQSVRFRWHGMQTLFTSPNLVVLDDGRRIFYFLELDFHFRVPCSCILDLLHSALRWHFVDEWIVSSNFHLMNER